MFLMKALRFLICLWIMLVSGNAFSERIEITGERFHLGVEGFPEWTHFKDSKPQGRQLDLNFKAKANTRESTLFIWQDDVKYAWTVRLNGKSLGRLINQEVKLISHFSVPVGLLRDGENQLSIIPPKNTDDIVVGQMILDERPFSEIAGESWVSVDVIETGKGSVPCRITIADEEGALVPVYTKPESTLPTGRGILPVKSEQKLAVRTGVVYTPDGKARIGLRPGKYTIYAGRGFEYSVATNHIDVATGETTRLNMELERVIDTTGWVATDCHIHNLTYSGHGSATIDEGMVTIAGEGIELAVATDHNHHTDYRESMQQMKVSRYFTSVIGNEVTTKAGHFNAFPIRPKSLFPDHKLTDWHALMRSIRERTGAKTIVLNHPRDSHSGFTPLGKDNFRQLSGESLRGEFRFDAMEVVTSAALQSDPMLLIRDWFGMLNRGYGITAVGSSDTHYVNRMILGQGRSYVKVDDSNVASIDVAQATKSLNQGRVMVSMGMLVDLRINGAHQIGDTVSFNGDLDLQIDIQLPKWARQSADSPIDIKVFANGAEMISMQMVPTTETKIQISKTLPGGKLPDQDCWISCVATAPGVIAPYWAIPRPYQVSDKTWRPKIIGLTNPIYIDRDKDGEYQSPKEVAETLINRHGLDFRKLFRSLTKSDQATAIQLASLLIEKGVDLDSPSVREAMVVSTQETQNGFSKYRAMLKSQPSDHQ